MSKRDRGDRGALVALGMALAAIVLVSFFDWLSNPQSQSVEQPAAQYDNAQGYQGEPIYFGVLKLSDTLAQWFAAIAATASIFVSVWAVRLVRATLKETRRAASGSLLANRNTMKAIRQNQDNAKRELRAYVFNENCVVESIRGDGWTLGLVVKNFGQTPAYNIRVAISTRGTRAPEIGTFPIPNFSEFLHDLAPNGFFQHLTSIENLPNYVIEDAKRGVEEVYVWGMIEYTDSFKDIQRKFFRLAHIGPIQVGSTNFRICPQGNQAT